MTRGLALAFAGAWFAIAGAAVGFGVAELWRRVWRRR